MDIYIMKRFLNSSSTYTKRVEKLKINSKKEITFDWIITNEKKIIELSDTIWMFAELALREYRSAKAHYDLLRSHGFGVGVGIVVMPTTSISIYGEGRPVIAL